MVVIGYQRAVAQGDPVNIHQLARRSRVFCGDHIGSGQNIQRAQSYIARRADGCGDKIQPGLKPAGTAVSVCIHLYFRAFTCRW